MALEKWVTTLMSTWLSHDCKPDLIASPLIEFFGAVTIVGLLRQEFLVDELQVQDAGLERGGAEELAARGARQVRRSVLMCALLAVMGRP